MDVLFVKMIRFAKCKWAEISVKQNSTDQHVFIWIHCSTLVDKLVDTLQSTNLVLSLMWRPLSFSPLGTTYSRWCMNKYLMCSVNYSITPMTLEQLCLIFTYEGVWMNGPSEDQKREIWLSLQLNHFSLIIPYTVCNYI